MLVASYILKAILQNEREDYFNDIWIAKSLNKKSPHRSANQNSVHGISEPGQQEWLWDHVSQCTLNGTYQIHPTYPSHLELIQVQSNVEINVPEPCIETHRKEILGNTEKSGSPALLKALNRDDERAR